MTDVGRNSLCDFVSQLDHWPSLGSSWFRPFTLINLLKQLYHRVEPRAPGHNRVVSVGGYFMTPRVRWA